MVGILFMSCIGLLILFISVSNFVVLFMVQGERRSKEIPFGYEIKYIYRVGGIDFIYFPFYHKKDDKFTEGNK